jgi:hypothetical protein
MKHTVINFSTASTHPARSRFPLNCFDVLGTLLTLDVTFFRWSPNGLALLTIYSKSGPKELVDKEAAVKPSCVQLGYRFRQVSSEESCDIIARGGRYLGRADYCVSRRVSVSECIGVHIL